MKKLLVLGIAVLALGLFVACGDDDNGTSATKTNAPSVTGAATTVKVGLQEWSVNPEVATVKSGTVAFAVTNTGPDDPHELVILKTDLAPDKLPVKANGSVEEDAAGITVVDEVEDLAVGESKTLTVDLAPGKYVFLCNIFDEDENEAHYKEGMRTGFTVQ